MLKIYAKEFTAIVKYLLENPEKATRKNKFLVVDKSLLTELLEKNNYEVSSKKLKAWKGLKWLDTDENRVTKRVTVNGTVKAMIKINLSVYETIREIGNE